MSNKRLKHVNRRLTEDERQRHAQIRKVAETDFPPKPETKRAPSPSGIPARIRQARVARGLTWYALAQAAGLANSRTIRDIEAGRDVQLSDLQSVAAALGLQLELVEQVA
jgi:DNA-binding XRE family transcriptional regulator